ncbi:hypothetical protein M231_02034 [Tremella mesenterica]|uniref:Uncharacterized protein n=1 Tax=Tremella mesenterica TaxID=5217 RepID=A0A4Q1BRK0_TREME|nr:hypothetical protein M231_02034 [Tremella mesenterica]
MLTLRPSIALVTRSCRRGYALAAQSFPDSDTEILETEPEPSHVPHPNLPSSSSSSSSSRVRSGTPRLSPRAKAFQNAKRLADAIRPSPSIPFPTSTAHSSESSHTHDANSRPRFDSPASLSSSTPPTLSDLLQKQPPGHPTDLSSKTYSKRYLVAWKSIDRSFLKTQLIVLMREMGLLMRGRSTKEERIRRILRSWGWEDPLVLKQIEDRERGAWEMREFGLTAGELFLIMRDKEVMRLLTGKDVEVGAGMGTGNMKEEKERGTVLRVRGRGEVLDHIAKILESRKFNTKNVKIPLEDLRGFDPPTEVLAAISTVSSVYLARDTTSIILSALNEADLSRAQALLQIATNELQVHPSQRSLTCLSPAPSLKSHIIPRLALMPHQTTSSQLMPWYHYSLHKAKGYFRLRAVESWTMKPAMRETEQRSQALDERPILGSSLSSQQTPDHSITLGQYLEKNMSEENPDEKRNITMTFGQILFPAEEIGPNASLTPPISGSMEFSDTQNLLTSRPSYSFIPGFTPVLTHFPPDSHPVRMRRIRYRSSKSRVTFTYRYPSIASTADSTTDIPNWLGELDEMLAKREVEEGNEFEEEAEDVIPDQGKESSVGKEDEKDLDWIPAVKFTAEVEEIEEMDILLPDRPVDIRCTTRQIRTLDPSLVPQEITDRFQVLSQHITLSKSSDHSIKTQISPTRENENSPTRQIQPTLPRMLNLGEEKMLLEGDDEMFMSSASTTGDEVVFRNVKVHDKLLNVGRMMEYSELETPSDNIPETFWRELSRVTRDVPPGASVRPASLI